jgi:hypothetical protein
MHHGATHPSDTDAMTVEWDHPHHASITLRVEHLRLETPNV